MRVFIADDSELLRDRLKTMLSDVQGVEVVGEAGNGHEALESIRALLPDAVVLDLQMPGCSGIEVLRAVRQSRLPVLSIVLSDCAQTHYKQACLKLGAAYVLDKATEFEKIRTILGPRQDGAET